MARPSRTARRSAAALAAAAVGLLLSAQSAFALIPIKTNTSIEIADPGGPTVTYSGRLVTKLGKGKPTAETRRAARRCLRGRKVVVESNGGVVGSTKSNLKGTWSVSGTKVPPGLNPRVFVARDVRGDILCGVILKSFEV